MELGAFRWALKRFTRRRRFVPFALELTTGRCLVVSHPEAVAADKDGYWFTAGT